MLGSVSATRPDPHAATEAIDRVVLHPLLGSLLFAAVMVLFFQLIFAWAAPAMDAIEAGVAAATAVARAWLPAGAMADFMADGIIAGVGLLYGDTGVLAAAAAEYVTVAARLPPDNSSRPRSRTRQGRGYEKDACGNPR